MYRKTTLLLGIILICSTVYSQQFLSPIVDHLQGQASAYPPDLIYLQTSKGIYETGEDLWFKAYELDAQSFGLSDKSKTLYLQLISPTDSIVWQEKYPIENGIVSGHVYVDEKLSEGDYMLEGYTRYSFYRDDTTSILPFRKIKIVNNIAQSGISVFQHDSVQKLTVQPESQESEGIVLRLDKQDDKNLIFSVSQENGLAEKKIYLTGQMRGMVCCIAKGTLRDSLKITIPLNNFLYQGIAEFTLSDSSMKPLADRLVYVQPNKKLYITLKPDKKSYGIREKATIKIKVTDEDGKPVRANLGVSVYDQAYINHADPINILTHCYLSSQLRKNISDPDYYFKEANKDRIAALDLFLQTQSSKNYIWNIAYSDYHGRPFLTDEITGLQTIKKKSKFQGQSAEQLIQVSGPEGNSQFVWADSTGHFAVDTDIMKTLRGGYLYLKPMLSDEFKPALEIEDSFSTLDSLRKKRPHYYPFVVQRENKNEQLLDLPVVSKDSTILLNEVTVTGKGVKTFRDKFMGRLDSLAQMSVGMPWVCECSKTLPYLNDYLPGYNHHSFGANSMVFNGVKHPPVVGKTYRIVKYDPKYVVDIKEIVYNGPFYSEEDLLRMNNYWRTKGYYSSHEFYQLDEIDIQSSIPDARNTLFWSPSVITDEKGEATVSFYCSDINTGFVCVAEGVDGAGLLGMGKCEFRVLR